MRQFHVAQAVPELLILLLQPPEYLDYRYTPLVQLSLAAAVLVFKVSFHKPLLSVTLSRRESVYDLFMVYSGWR